MNRITKQTKSKCFSLKLCWENFRYISALLDSNFTLSYCLDWFAGHAKSLCKQRLHVVSKSWVIMTKNFTGRSYKGFFEINQSEYHKWDQRCVFATNQRRENELCTNQKQKRCLRIRKGVIRCYATSHILSEQNLTGAADQTFRNRCLLHFSSINRHYRTFQNPQD